MTRIWVDGFEWTVGLEIFHGRIRLCWCASHKYLSVILADNNAVYCTVKDIQHSLSYSERFITYPSWIIYHMGSMTPLVCPRIKIWCLYWDRGWKSGLCYNCQLTCWCAKIVYKKDHFQGGLAVLSCHAPTFFYKVLLSLRSLCLYLPPPHLFQGW